jgi:hypothetical protein
MGVGGQLHAPAALSPGMTRYPLYRRLGGPQGWSGRVLKISPPLGLNPWTIQPIVSRYAIYAIPALDTQYYISQLMGSQRKILHSGMTLQNLRIFS